VDYVLIRTDLGQQIIGQPTTPYQRYLFDLYGQTEYMNWTPWFGYGVLACIVILCAAVAVFIGEML